MHVCTNRCYLHIAWFCSLCITPPEERSAFLRRLRAFGEGAAGEPSYIIHLEWMTKQAFISHTIQGRRMPQIWKQAKSFWLIAWLKHILPQQAWSYYLWNKSFNRQGSLREWLPQNIQSGLSLLSETQLDGSHPWEEPSLTAIPSQTGDGLGQSHSFRTYAVHKFHWLTGSAGGTPYGPAVILGGMGGEDGRQDTFHLKTILALIHNIQVIWRSRG